MNILSVKSEEQTESHSNQEPYEGMIKLKKPKKKNNEHIRSHPNPDIAYFDSILGEPTIWIPFFGILSPDTG